MEIDVDMIYLVALPERRAEAEKLLESFGWQFTTFPAIKLEDGAAGLNQTMKMVMKDAVLHGYKRFMVFEDDVTLVPNFMWTFQYCLRQLPYDFLLLYAGVNLCHYPKRYSEHLLELKKGLSSHAIVYSYGAACYIWNILNENLKNIPYDKLLRDRVQILGNCYCSYPLLATQKEGFSFIQKKNVSYDFHKKFKRFTKHIK